MDRSADARRPTIRLLLSDVDGTLVTPDKVLTERTCQAVGQLRQAGIEFAITSGRPPRGMSMLVEPLKITTPIAAFNGGVLVMPDCATLEEHVLPADVVARVISIIAAQALDAWVYRGSDWFVRNPTGAHVEREKHTVQFAPKIVGDFAGFRDNVAKIVGVSDDHEAVACAEAALRDALGDYVSATRSQPYYLDVTHPDANKGAVARRLSQLLKIPTDQIATIGDMPNDVLMFAHSGLSIAMGNAAREVQRAARHVTTSNEAEGFANAVERFILRCGPGTKRAATSKGNPQETKT